jgi:hypothetical protein
MQDLIGPQTLKLTDIIRDIRHEEQAPHNNNNTGIQKHTYEVLLLGI